MKRIPIVFLFAVLTMTTALPAVAQTVTTLLRSGPNAQKFNLVIIGDGFAAGNDQTVFDNLVRDMILRDLFSETRNDVFRETMNAYNIFRINTVSAQSGVTTVDAQGNVTSAVNTFLDMRFSGIWDRCWMEWGPNTATTLNNTLNNLVPGWTQAFIVLNTTGFGGCAWGNVLGITRGVAWQVAGHEMGHMIGGLADEYSVRTETYTGPEPGAVNLTITLNSLKWGEFVNPATPIPTANTFGGDPIHDAGAFEGGQYVTNGIYRPALNSRMNGNADAFCPIGYNQMRVVSDPNQDRLYRKVYSGRFTGGPEDDVVIHNSNSVALFRGNGNQLTPVWSRTLPDPVWDSYLSGDQFLVGDFDGDGRSDLFVFNATDWAMPYFAMLRSGGNGFEGIRRFDRVLPGWGDMKLHDKFFVADVDGDRRDDILVFNGEDWAVGYLLVLRSTGNDLQFVRRFDDMLPGWGSMKRNDEFFVADFDADGRKDLYVSNQRDWAIGYLEMLRSNGSGYNFVRRFDRVLPGWGDMKPGDRFFAADFDGDSRKDIYVYNGGDWSMPYLEMLRSTSNNLAFVRRFDRNVPGWGEMREHDTWFVADVNGDRRQDLYVFNALDWATEYVGTLQSSGSNLNGGFQGDWIGSWNLGNVDRFLVLNFNGGAGWDDLLVYNDDWLGLLRSFSASVSLSSIYPKWVHNHNYHSLGWW